MSGENRKITIRSKAVVVSDGSSQNAVQLETIIRDQDDDTDVVGRISLRYTATNTQNVQRPRSDLYDYMQSYQDHRRQTDRTPNIAIPATSAAILPRQSPQRHSAIVPRRTNPNLIPSRAYVPYITTGASNKSGDETNKRCNSTNVSKNVEPASNLIPRAADPPIVDLTCDEEQNLKLEIPEQQLEDVENVLQVPVIMSSNHNDSERQFDNSQYFDNVSLSSNDPAPEKNITEQEANTKQQQITQTPLLHDDHQLHVDNFNFNGSQQNHLSGRQIDSLLNNATLQNINPGHQDNRLNLAHDNGDGMPVNKFLLKPPRFNHQASHINDDQQNMPGMNLDCMLPAQNNYPDLFDDVCEEMPQRDMMYPGQQLQNVDMDQLYHDPGMQPIQFDNSRRQIDDSSPNMPIFYNSPGQPLDESYMMQQPSQMLPVGPQMVLYDGQSQTQMPSSQDQMQMLLRMRNDVGLYQTQPNVGQNLAQLLFDARNNQRQMRPDGEMNQTIRNYLLGENENNPGGSMQSVMTYNQQMSLHNRFELDSGNGHYRAMLQYFALNRLSRMQSQAQIRPGEQNIMQALNIDQTQRFVGRLSTDRQNQSKMGSGAGPNQFQMNIGRQNQTQMSSRTLENRTQNDCNDWRKVPMDVISKAVQDALQKYKLEQQMEDPSAPETIEVEPNVTKPANQSVAQKGPQEKALDLSKLKD